MINARHILVKVKPSTVSTKKQFDQAYNFLVEVLDDKEKDSEAWSSESFRRIASSREIEVTESDYFQESDGPRAILQKIGFFPEAVEWTFSAETGDISGVMEHKDFGFFVFHLLDRKDAAPKLLEDVDNSISQKLRREKKLDYAYGKADEFDSLLATGLTIEDASLKTGKELNDHQVTRETYMPTISRHPKFMAKVFSLAEGETSRAIKLEDRFTTSFVKVIKKYPSDMENFEENKAELRQELLEDNLGGIFDKWLYFAREKAAIEDFRKSPDKDSDSPEPEEPV